MLDNRMREEREPKFMTATRQTDEVQRDAVKAKKRSKTQEVPARSDLLPYGIIRDRIMREEKKKRKQKTESNHAVHKLTGDEPRHGGYQRHGGYS